METTRLITLGTLATGGVSTVAGSAMAGTAAPADSVKLENPFEAFDLLCVKDKQKTALVDLSNPERVSQKISETESASQLGLPSVPSPVNGTVKGCLRTVLQGKPKEPKIKNEGAIFSVEMAVEKGDYGIILMNALTNMKKYGGGTNAYRALFLKKENSKWEIKGGVQWFDSASSSKIGSAKKVKWSGLSSGQKEYDWQAAPDTDYKYSHYWKTPAGKDKNIYQELNIRLDDAVVGQEFWNEPLNASSNVTNPTALFVDGQWKKAISPKVDKTVIQSWFNVFKGDKGGW